MESIRLTNRHRDSIRKTLLEDRFRETKRKIREDREQLALDIYHKTFSADSIKKMNDLPVGWLPEVEKVAAEITGSVEVFKFPEGVAHRVPSEKSNPWNSDTSLPLLKLSGSSPLGKRYLDICNRRSTMLAEKDQLHAEIGAVLRSVTTTKRLIEEWPEIESVVRKCVNLPQSSALPVLRVDQLTRRLGLEKTAEPVA